MSRKIVTGFVLALSLCMPILISGPHVVETESIEASYSVHDPISITSDSNFTSANGVVSGTGTSTDPYVISGWNITKAWGDGIKVTGTSKHFCIRDNLISYTSHTGIIIRDVSDGTCEIRNNIVEYAYDNGIAIDTNGVHIENNSVTYSRQSGILVSWCNDNHVIRNTCNHNNVALDTWVAGIYVDHSSNNTIHNNTANHNGPNGKGIWLIRESNLNVVSNNTISNNPLGLLVGDNAERNTIVNNTITDNSNGFWLGTSQNIISGNTVENNDGYGIQLYNSFNNTLSSNMIINNTYSIHLVRSSDNTINGSNTIAYNDHGVFVSEDSTNNYVHHNNFLMNVVQAVQNGLNYWNESSEGNYWSDYEGIDVDGDGIGDTETPHHRDSYPFIVPLGPIPVFHEETRYDCNVDSNLTVSRFNLDKGKTMSFNINGQGYINLTIPRTMLDGSFQVFVGDTPKLCLLAWSPPLLPTYIYIFFEHATTSPINVRIEALIRLQGDVNGDGKVNIIDLTVAAKNFGKQLNP